MKFSEQWLREWVNPDLTTAVLGHQLTMAGLEVDAIEPVAPTHTGVVVGKILSAEQHPDADKLQVCLVDVGALCEEPLQIVCGAKNARKGLLVACAMVKAVLPGDFKIKKSRLRGVLSSGMLCSEKELGLADSADGIMELPEDAPIGTTINDYLQLNDVSIELGVTPNRGDCFSIAGVARETGVMTRNDVKAVEIIKQTASIDDTMNINIEAREACPRYAGRVIKNVNILAKTPMWMQEKLRRCGHRSISPLVDITNFVMIELGQPMHAFDLDKIQGQINVRMASQGEKLTLLDGQEIFLNADNLVIADNEQALALAGIMGGESSAVSDDTKDILLESAFFNPEMIIGKARAHGLHTDSSHRFERGVSPQLQAEAIERATQLILQISGGEEGPIVEQSFDEYTPKAKSILLKKEKITKVLGIEIDNETVKDVLTRLEMNVVDCENGWQVTAPAFRFDIEYDVDLIEEIGRIYGYDNLPSTLPHGSIAMSACPEDHINELKVKELLVSLGYQEAICYSFVEPKMQNLITPDNPGIKLSNPISEDLSVMRTSLWTGLIGALVYNQNRQQNRIRLFEMGSRFVPGGSDKTEDKLLQEVMIAGIINGSAFPEQWGEKVRAVDFYDLKADVEAILSLGGDLSAYHFSAELNPALHPGQSARIYKDNQAVGWMGTLHPSVAKAMDVKSTCILFELEFDAISVAKVPEFKILSKFPAIRRDIAIIVDDETKSSAIINCIRQTAENELAQDKDSLKENHQSNVTVELFDVYIGEGVEAGKRSLAVSLSLQEQSRTLKDDEIDTLIQAVLSDLEQQHGAKLRD
ncbi:MAG: phenylalanine--tRNA ligase subunit beta [gamma proteobacterium symbiont of Bathyaustriella thionipta]|nr:phenylalanine--tRNA ligase subunit beta [gamma proteobacterium symbiont of Bathyaustriella thionipta]MCU7949332.1 phenylalanine--tRNA ligase subunit beta [gamma proteobacterium symbiont of Bathyaustriella thionipta]MCU7954918.1 phenylalanine--tRNA ligase subunit beta [gamma proteobacterium symbiont of Bathyaustriella thionipta]MCU7955921.1 phenylalanine--tRNA ligase subunit beta [gamma proteobacterium symbiont of Bathyaustriella thionipta]MCU7968189.1 phenylalanine--tRNA ligase subunit beta 